MLFPISRAVVTVEAALCRWQCLAAKCLERDPGLLPREEMCLQVHEKDSKQGGWWRTLAAPKKKETEETQTAEVEE